MVCSLITSLSYDRYRTTVTTTWKDQPLPGAGATYNLGSHLIDQALCLFGRPHKLTAFLQNVRGLGQPDVDDCVRYQLYSALQPLMIPKFTIYMHYRAGSALPKPMTAILRAHILSVRDPQCRFIVRGDKGTYLKTGIDTQEDSLKGISDPREILAEGFGLEPESVWGTLENLGQDGISFHKSR
jgi:predicted dehydrogenase